MENQIQTAYVLADQDAPCTNSVKYNKIKSNREKMLCEAFWLLAQLNDKQIIKLCNEIQGWKYA